MTLKEFLSKYTNKFVEVAGSANAKNQCVDLVNAYIRDVLNLPIIEWTNAQDFPSKAGDNYEYIKNTPEGVPQEGDIVVWKSADNVGHIGVFIEGDTRRFTSFDQNYPTGTPAHIQEHNYRNVIGWLRKKGGAMTCEIKDSNGKIRTMEWLLREWEVEKDRAERLAKENDSYKDKVGEVSDENNTLRNQLEATDKRWKEIELQLRTQVEDLAGRVNISEKEITSLREAHSASESKLEVAERALEIQEKELSDLRGQLEAVLVATPSKTLLWVLLKRVLLRKKVS